MQCRAPHQAFTLTFRPYRKNMTVFCAGQRVNCLSCKVSAQSAATSALTLHGTSLQVHPLLPDHCRNVAQAQRLKSLETAHRQSLSERSCRSCSSKSSFGLLMSRPVMPLNCTLDSCSPGPSTCFQKTGLQAWLMKVCIIACITNLTHLVCTFAV